MAITDAWLRANSGKGRGGVEVFTDRDGLSVRASAKGKLVFQIRYRYAGRAKRLDIGSYPHMTLRAARSECERLRGELERGRDPKVVLMVERADLAGPGSFREVFEQYYQSYCAKHKKTHQQILRSFELHVFPALGAVPVAEITVHTWLALLEGVADKKPAIAGRLVSEIKLLYAWALRRQLVASNPMAAITARKDLGIKKQVNKRALSDDEVRLLWEALEHSRIAEKNKLVMRLCLFYGCRVGELRLAEKSHFDFDAMVWTVPPENHKTGVHTGRPILRPIIPQVVPWIERAMALSGSDRWMFTCADSSDPMGEQALLSPPYNVMQWVRRRKGVEMAHWSMHALRKTARTNFSRITSPFVAEVMLGHSLRITSEQGAYDFYDYLDEQRAAYAAWWDRLQGIVAD